MSLMSEEWVGMVKDSETGLIKQNAKINLWDQLYKLDINAVYLRIRALLYWMSLNRKQILFQYRYRNVKNLKIYLYQIFRNSLKMYNDRAVRLLRKEC